MTDTIRCPACRGSKKVPKLGGMIGECNTCLGQGTILAVDKPQPVVVEPVTSNVDIINAVAQVMPCNTIIGVKDEAVHPDALPEEPVIKINPKKVIYKRKKA